MILCDLGLRLFDFEKTEKGFLLPFGRPLRAFMFVSFKFCLSSDKPEIFNSSLASVGNEFVTLEMSVDNLDWEESFKKVQASS